MPGPLAWDVLPEVPALLQTGQKAAPLAAGQNSRPRLLLFLGLCLLLLLLLCLSCSILVGI